LERAWRRARVSGLNLEMSLEICRRRAGETTAIFRLGVIRAFRTRRARVDLTRLAEARRIALGDRRLVDRRLTGI
jgi:hypothetical protein